MFIEKPTGSANDSEILHHDNQDNEKDGRSKNRINSEPSGIKMCTYFGPLFLKKGPHRPIPRMKPW